MPQNLTFFENFKTKILIFEYCPNISSEMNPILIPNVPYVNFLFTSHCLIGVPGVKKSIKYFNWSLYEIL